MKTYKSLKKAFKNEKRNWIEIDVLEPDAVIEEIALKSVETMMEHSICLLINIEGFTLRIPHSASQKQIIAAYKEKVDKIARYVPPRPPWMNPGG